MKVYCILSKTKELNLVYSVKTFKHNELIAEKIFLGNEEQDVFSEVVKECHKYVPHIDIEGIEYLLERDYKITFDNFTFIVECDCDCVEYKSI